MTRRRLLREDPPLILSNGAPPVRQNIPRSNLQLRRRRRRSPLSRRRRRGHLSAAAEGPPFGGGGHGGECSSPNSLPGTPVLPVDLSSLFCPVLLIEGERRRRGERSPWSGRE